MASAALNERMLPKEVFQTSAVESGTAESRQVSGHSAAPGCGSARSRSTSAGSSSGSPGSACIAGEVAPHWASAQEWKPSVVLERMLVASFVEPPPGLEGFIEARKECLGAITTPGTFPAEPTKSVRQRAAPPPPPAAPPVLAPGLSAGWQMGQVPPPDHVALSLPREPEPLSFLPPSPLPALTLPPALAFPPVGMPPDVQIPMAMPLPRAQPELGSEACPTVGSAGHLLGLCKPCAFFHTKGCQGGTSCVFCHLCLPGEKKRRQKVRLAPR
eukprot:TRINITY_DN29334_c0_g1_i1.p1 TRINITY_DN29334_c0_g1~~TRINITY_DN29334_c0_g1_i1.p1  ORF type:complete len:272 (-),score=47.43 TRINITY_DN29334_c0_g1_i1:118-933(-)